MSINQNLELVIISFTLVNSVCELKEEERGGGGWYYQEKLDGGHS